MSRLPAVPSACPSQRIRAVTSGQPRLVPTWLPILAIAISLWSAYNSWRSRRTSERSAGLTEQRRREEEAPTIEYVSANEAPEEGIRVVNETTVAYESVRFTIVPSRDEPTPVNALKVEYDEPGWDSLSDGSRREKPETLGRSDPTNPDFWTFAGPTRASNPQRPARCG
jgi:hypothetical protein